VGSGGKIQRQSVQRRPATRNEKLLLDTHIWIWSYLEPHKISSEVSRELTNPRNDRFLSAVSVWEAIVLLEKKRIQFKRDFGRVFRESKEELNLTEVPSAGKLRTNCGSRCWDIAIQRTGFWWRRRRYMI